MSGDWLNLCYLITAVMFIAALKALNSPRTARLGNAIAALGMLMAVAGTLMARGTVTYTWIIVGIVVGGTIGSVMALKIRMTAVPQMVSFFNGSGGLAAALVAVVHYSAFGHAGSASSSTSAQLVGQAFTTGLSALIGLMSFTGSMVAVAKLQEWLHPRPIVLPMQHAINALLLAVVAALIALLCVYPQMGAWLIVPIVIVSAVLGVMVVLPIGGGDMPVVVALLNSFTGLAAAATGFLLSNTGLIISGALVGASGSILTHLMCQAMNRPLGNVLFGTFGKIEAAAASGPQRTVRRYTVQDAQIVLQNASSVVIVPGYGLAVARAHYAVKEMADLLEAQGVSVKYAVHPVAGRMPGHMNVLLAEANVPYAKLLDLDEGNRELEHADVALVVGANDVTNPAARTDKASPIYGMPILNVDHAKTVIVCKRSMSPGFAGIDNPLFYSDNTLMLFGDAKETFTNLVTLMKADVAAA